MMGTGHPMAHALVALPQERFAQVAEAWGCAAARQLLLDRVPGPARVLVAGDNLAVIRYCASQGMLRQPGMAGPLHTSLTKVAVVGHSLTWIAVRRKHNKAADALATEALQWAADLRDRGSLAQTVRFLDGAPGGAAGHH